MYQFTPCWIRLWCYFFNLNLIIIKKYFQAQPNTWAEKAHGGKGVVGTIYIKQSDEKFRESEKVDVQLCRLYQLVSNTVSETCWLDLHKSKTLWMNFTKVSDSLFSLFFHLAPSLSFHAEKCELRVIWLFKRQNVELLRLKILEKYICTRTSSLGTQIFFFHNHTPEGGSQSTVEKIEKRISLKRHIRFFFLILWIALGST